ncbi:MAG TPA: PhzF family phenazine biosynthesis protein [Gammaproteobacteria bacterium]|nr:PhzF family phenazine biosynthesis protein [Gammaproteobacteria bacterium]
MRIPIYQIGAFTGERFCGNPAAVCPLEEWLPDELMQKIAAENNLSETAFFVPQTDSYQLRWFTPTTEVDLCGHATLASAYVIARILKLRMRRIAFTSNSGPLVVDVDGDLIRLDFPADPPHPVAPPPGLELALGFAAQEVQGSRLQYLLVLAAEVKVRGFKPDMPMLARLDYKGVIVTAAGEDCDFVSRFFAPRLGVPEDPVTGSAHCVLVPYWAARLGKNKLHARQLSPRGGELFCEAHGARVWMAGRAVKYLEGFIEL